MATPRKKKALDMTNIEERGPGAFRFSTRYRGWARIQFTVSSATQAREYLDYLALLHKHGHKQLFELLKPPSHRITIGDLKRRIPPHQVVVMTTQEILLRIATSTPEALGSAYDKWISAMETGQVTNPKTKQTTAPSTVRRYKSNFAKIWPHIPKTTIVGEIDQPMVAGMAAKRNTEKVSSHTVNRDLAALQSLLSWASKRSGLNMAVQKIDFSEIKVREPKFHKDKQLTPAKYQEIRPFVPEEDRDVYDFLAHTGLRLGELLGLRRMDVVLTGPVPQIKVRVAADGGRLKTPESVRDVPLSIEAQAILTKWMKGTSGGTTKVLPKHFGKETRIHRRFHLAVRNSGAHDNGHLWSTRYADKEPTRPGRNLKCDFTVHSLRHTFGITLAKQSIPAIHIAHMLGHSNIETAQRYFDALQEETDMAKAAKALSSGLAENPILPPEAPHVRPNGPRKETRKRVSPGKTGAVV